MEIELKEQLLRESKAGWQEGGLFPGIPKGDAIHSIVIPESMRETRQSQIQHRAQITDGGNRPKP